jgi:hypothetical protein
MRDEQAIVLHLLAVLLFIATLTWNDNSWNEDGFIVQKTISGNCTDGWYEVARVGIDVTSWTDETSQAGDCYRVSAFNSDGESGYTNTAQVPEEKPCKGKHC